MSRPAPEPTVAHVVRDAVSDAVGVDGALWQTLALLIRQPSALADAYARGDVRGLLRPTRLYLLASLTLFTALTLADPGAALGAMLSDFERTHLASGQRGADAELVADLERMAREARGQSDYQAGLARRLDSLAAAVPGGTSRQAGAAAVTAPPEGAGAAREGTEEDVAAAQAVVVGTLFEWLPLALIVLVPVQAIGLYLSVGRRRSGVAALALAAHGHVVAYLALVIAVAAHWLAGWGTTAVLIPPALVAAAAWQTAAARRVYDVTTARAALAVVGVGVGYLVGVALVAGFLYAVAIAFYLHDLAG